MIGTTLGHYKILDKIGGGGFATVYLARDLRTNEVVALKVLHQQYAEDAQFIARFRREAETIRSLPHHPHIVKLREFGEDKGKYYIAMEYLEGIDLNEILAQRGRLPIDEALSIAAQVAEALQVASQHGVVHRDIKPQNVKITPSGVAKVMDFGIARATEGTKLTKTGAFIGTPAYIAPEIWKGKPADSRTDIYALGVVLYEMLAGKAPFEADTPAAVIRMHLQEEPQPLPSLRPDVPPGVARLVARALAKRPEERYQTPGEMLTALRRKEEVEAPTIVEPVPRRPRVAPPAPPSRPVARKPRGIALPLVFGIVTVLLLCGVVIGGVAILGRGEGGLPPAGLFASPTPIQTPTPWATPAPPTPTSRPTLTPIGGGLPISTPPPTAKDTPIASPPVLPTVTLPATMSPQPTPTPPPSPALRGKIAFAVFNSGAPESRPYDLYVINADGSGRRGLADNASQPAYSPDGSKLAIHSTKEFQEGIVIMNATGGNRQTITHHKEDSYPCWSTDGKSLVFSSTRHGDRKSRLYRVKATYGSWEKPLWEDVMHYGTGGELFGEHPTWLSDGRIVYKGCDLQGECGLVVISGEGGTPQRITTDPGDTAPHSYGSQIAFMSHQDGNWEVYVVNADGSGLKRLTNNLANDGLPTWSPDGRLIAFVSDRDGAWGVWVMNADGGDQRKLFALEGEYSPRSGQQWRTERIDWAP